MNVHQAIEMHKQIELLAEEILIDSGYREDVQEWYDTVQTVLDRCGLDALVWLLLQYMCKLVQDEYDYDPETGEQPWNGAAAWMAQVDQAIATAQQHRTGGKQG